jgi:hypothetical protein
MPDKDTELAWLIKVGQMKENATPSKATTKTDEE